MSDKGKEVKCQADRDSIANLVYWRYKSEGPGDKEVEYCGTKYIGTVKDDGIVFSKPEVTSIRRK